MRAKKAMTRSDNNSSDHDSRASPCNCLALRQAARHVSQLYDTHLAREGLRATQFSVLAKLNHLGPLSINQLAQAMVMDRTTLGRAIRPLERDSFIKVAPTDDGRRRSLCLTPAGKAKLQRARKKWSEAQREFESQYGKRDATELRQTLLAVIDRVAAGGPDKRGSRRCRSSRDAVRFLTAR
jgi:DNA-binding MarR family transcriptional regulator